MSKQTDNEILRELVRDFTTMELPVYRAKCELLAEKMSKSANTSISADIIHVNVMVARNMA